MKKYMIASIVIPIIVAIIGYFVHTKTTDDIVVAVFVIALAPFGIFTIVWLLWYIWQGIVMLYNKLFK